MKLSLLCFYLNVILFSCLQTIARPSAVTYHDTGGRLGDFLIAYSNARWISYKFNLKFLYRPFKELRNSDQFAFSRIHDAIDFETESKQFKKVHYFEHKDIEKRINFESEDVLYVLPFTIYNFFLYNATKKNLIDPDFKIDWEDKRFTSLLRTETSSLVPIPQIEVPKDRHLVALHVRTGVDFDSVPEEIFIGCDSCSKSRLDGHKIANEHWFPGKFPHYSYYIQQIERLSAKLNDEPIYVQIFTDNPNPGKIAKLFKAYLNKPNIEFGFRSEGNKDSINVVEDFFAFSQFDYLIHPISCFSMVASRLFKYKLCIYPLDSEVKNNQVVIKHVVIRSMTKKGGKEEIVSAGSHFDWERFCDLGMNYLKV